MTNYEIADHFTLLAKLMDIHSENPFKSKSYAIAAYNIENLPQEIEEMDDAMLFAQKGIGESTGKKIREIQATGKLDQLEKIMAATPPGVLEMLSIKGLGPKKIAGIWKQMGIESLGELEYACNENRLASFKGFGQKTQAAVLESIQFYHSNQGLHLWAEVHGFANAFCQKLRESYAGFRFELTGAVRRQDEIIEFIDYVTDADRQLIVDNFSALPDTECETLPENILVVRLPQQPAIRFFTGEPSDFFKRLFLTTGSPEFMEAFLQKYSFPPQPVSEEEIFSANNLSVIPPALRETAATLDRAAANNLPTLIRPSDIRGIIHSHSTWSDGNDTLEKMAAAARDQGFEYLVISDHSQTATYAQGLKPDRIAAQHIEIAALNEQLAPFKIFKSIESDILGDGSLDYPAQILNTFDLVIASVHSNLKMPLDKAMSRLLSAIANPFTTILGHPTGRLLLSRQGYPVDHQRIIDACAEHNVVIEINAHPKRLDMDWHWIEYAMSKGVLLSVDPDAHSVQGFRDVYYGVMNAQKGGLTAEFNLSSFTLAEFETFLAKQRAKRAALKTL